MPDPARTSLTNLLAALDAAAESTRLRLLSLLAEAELTVTELVTILGQSQPRVSRHLKLLVEAGLVERHREGAWAFFLLAGQGAQAALASDLLQRLDRNDPMIAADRARLQEVRHARAEQAARYFASHAADWDKVRALHVPEARVEAAIADIVGEGALLSLLDLGTGTGRMLELLAPRAVRAVGIDQSPAMLSVARATLEKAGLRNVQLRQGDIYALPLERDGYDLIVVHQVLHYLDDPARALREAARVLRPGGRMIVADFAPHTQEVLRDSHAHRRLGFGAVEVSGFMSDAGLEPLLHRDLKPQSNEPNKLTVSIWVGRDRRLAADAPISDHERQVA